jgi:hypothetical protein
MAKQDVHSSQLTYKDYLLFPDDGPRGKQSGFVACCLPRFAFCPLHFELTTLAAY